MSRGKDNERLARNAASKEYADNDGEHWDHDDLEFLLDWNGTEEDLKVIAELLGRTIEACRQRYYTAKRIGHRVTVIEKETTYKVTGWLVGFCFKCGSFTDVYSDGEVSKCEECR